MAPPPVLIKLYYVHKLSQLGLTVGFEAKLGRMGYVMIHSTLLLTALLIFFVDVTKTLLYEPVSVK